MSWATRIWSTAASRVPAAITAAWRPTAPHPHSRGRGGEPCRPTRRVCWPRKTGSDPAKITPKLVTDCAKAGDPAATAVFDDYIEHLSSACASIYNILDPEVLALGGGLSAAGPFLFDPLQDKVSKKCFYSTRGKLVPAVLGNEAGMIGAALLARDAEA